MTALETAFEERERIRSNLYAMYEAWERLRWWNWLRRRALRAAYRETVDELEDADLRIERLHAMERLAAPDVTSAPDEAAEPDYEQANGPAGGASGVPGSGAAA